MGVFVRQEQVAASPDIGPLVHTVYSVRATSHIQTENERGVCNMEYERSNGNGSWTKIYEHVTTRFL